MIKFIVDQQVEDIEMPENLKLNTFLSEFHSDCTHPECSFGYYGFAFGQAPFQVPQLLKESLSKNASKGKYSSVSGIEELRDAISEYSEHYFKIKTDRKSIFVGPGTKELIYNLLELLHGTVILPTPAWLGYLPQIRFLRKNFHMLPTGATKKINPLDLEHLALRLQDRQKILILNNPNNPTGLIYSRLELEEIADVCRKYEIVVISDEIYATTTYDFNQFVSMATIYPEGTFTTNGLSKSHAAGGYRLGYVIFPQDTDGIKIHFKKILATEYTATSTPIQHAAISAFRYSEEMDDYLTITRNIHRIMGEYTYSFLCGIDGVTATRPQATFYLLANFNNFTQDLHVKKILTAKQLSESFILHPYHTAIVGGDSLVLERTDFSARLAFVDYDGALVFDRYAKSPPKTRSDEKDFVETNAPRLVAGLNMIEKYLHDLKKETNTTLMMNKPSILQ